MHDGTVSKNSIFYCICSDLANSQLKASQNKFSVEQLELKHKKINFSDKRDC